MGLASVLHPHDVVPVQKIKSSENNKCVIQKYIPRPLLVEGFKFDLRLYILIPSFWPLRCFVHKRGTADAPHPDTATTFANVLNFSFYTRVENIAVAAWHVVPRRVGLVRFSTEKYDTSDLANSYSHLTNSSINKNAPKRYKVAQGLRVHAGGNLCVSTTQRDDARFFQGTERGRQACAGEGGQMDLGRPFSDPARAFFRALASVTHCERFGMYTLPG